MTRLSPLNVKQMANVVDHLIATDDSEMLVMSMLRGEDLQSVLVDEAALPTPNQTCSLVLSRTSWWTRRRS